MTISKNVQDALFSWLGRGVLTVLTLLTYFIYVDVKEFAESMQSIKTEQAVQKQSLNNHTTEIQETKKRISDIENRERRTNLYPYVQ